jgi:hypothetical protein
MFETFFTKENLALAGVVSLFVWRILDFIIRQNKKRENELQKLAFEMAKYRCDSDEMSYSEESFFSYYLFYLDALEHDLKPYDNQKYEIMKEFEERAISHIKRLEDVAKKIQGISENLEDKHQITLEDLWELHFSWSLWRHITATLLKRTFKHRRTFRSV